MIKFELGEGDIALSKKSDDNYCIYVLDGHHWTSASIDNINRKQLIQIKDALDFILEK